MIRKTLSVKRPRRWQCKYDGFVNEPGKKKCAACQSKRDKKAASFEAEARMFHRQLVCGGRVCFFCGCPLVQDCHILQKGANPNPALKWHPDNGLPGCACPEHRCHYKFDSYQFGDRGVIAVKFMGEARYAELQRIATTRWDRDWPAVIARLRAALAAK